MDSNFFQNILKAQESLLQDAGVQEHINIFLVRRFCEAVLKRSRGWPHPSHTYPY